MANSVGIRIGHDQLAMKEIRQMVNDILRSKNDQSTKIAALGVIEKGLKIEHVSINNVSIDQGESK